MHSLVFILLFVVGIYALAAMAIAGLVVLAVSSCILLVLFVAAGAGLAAVPPRLLRKFVFGLVVLTGGMVCLGFLMKTFGLVPAPPPPEPDSPAGLVAAGVTDYGSDTGRLAADLRAMRYKAGDEVVVSTDAVIMRDRHGGPLYWRKEISGYNAWLCFYPASGAEPDFRQKLGAKSPQRLRCRLARMDATRRSGAPNRPHLTVSFTDVRLLSSVE